MKLEHQISLKRLLRAMDIKSVVFGFDWTLANSDVWVQSLAQYCGSRLGVDPVAFESMYRAKCADKLDAEGSVTLETLKAVGVEDPQQFYATIPWNDLADPVLYRNVGFIFKELKAFGVKVAVLTNHRKNAERILLADPDVAASAYVIWTQESFPQGKPHTTTFQVCADLLGCTMKQILFVGDRPDKEIIPARALGMRTIRFSQQGPFSQQRIGHIGKRADVDMGNLNDFFNALVI